MSRGPNHLQTDKGVVGNRERLSATFAPGEQANVETCLGDIDSDVAGSFQGLWCSCG